MPFEELGLELAWRRLKLGRHERCFVTHPWDTEWIELDLEGWLGSVSERLFCGYDPHPASLCYRPKGSWMVRPGNILQLDDEVVYNAIVGHCHDRIWGRIGQAQGDPDCGHKLIAPGTVRWVEHGFLPWDAWRKSSLAALDEGTFFVLFTDVSGFYENIDLAKLVSDLADLGVDDDARNLLSKCLNSWSHPRCKGIPQGYSGSDILAKLYMDPVDRGLRNAAFKHLRYVDDIRVFCRTRLEAKEALLTLNDLLRARGLNLQSAKTEILSVEQARKKIDGVGPLIRSIGEEMAREIADIGGLDETYGTLSDIDRLLEANPDAPPPPILERAFLEHFIEGNEPFDKTLFHYLLTRLGRVESPIAVNYCLQQLRVRPEETDYVLRYFSALGHSTEAAEAVADYAGSDDAIYDYQLFEIARWFHKQETVPPGLVTLCRAWAFDGNRLLWLRAYAMALLGRHGDVADLDALERHWPNTASEMDHASLVMAVSGMERSRRNAFLARVANEGELVNRAIALVKGQQ